MCFRGVNNRAINMGSHSQKEGDLSMKRFMVIALLTLSFAVFSKNSFADDATLDTLNEKLEQVLANQDKIWNELQQLRTELNVVKIRTTQ